MDDALINYMASKGRAPSIGYSHGQAFVRGFRSRPGAAQSSRNINPGIAGNPDGGLTPSANWNGFFAGNRAPSSTGLAGAPSAAVPDLTPSNPVPATEMAAQVPPMAYTTGDAGFDKAPVASLSPTLPSPRAPQDYLAAAVGGHEKWFDSNGLGRPAPGADRPSTIGTNFTSKFGTGSINYPQQLARLGAPSGLDIPEED